MTEIVIRFPAGSYTQHTFRQALWNLEDRALTGGPIVVEVDGERQTWWDEDVARRGELHRQAREKVRQTQAMQDRVDETIARLAAQGRTDEEIVVELQAITGWFDPADWSSVMAVEDRRRRLQAGHG